MQGGVSFFSHPGLVWTQKANICKISNVGKVTHLFPQEISLTEIQRGGLRKRERYPGRDIKVQWTKKDKVRMLLIQRQREEKRGNRMKKKRHIISMWSLGKNSLFVEWYLSAPWLSLEIILHCGLLYQIKPPSVSNRLSQRVARWKGKRQKQVADIPNHFVLKMRVTA